MSRRNSNYNIILYATIAIAAYALYTGVFCNRIKEPEREKVSLERTRVIERYEDVSKTGTIILGFESYRFISGKDEFAVEFEDARAFRCLARHFSKYNIPKKYKVILKGDLLSGGDYGHLGTLRKKIIIKSIVPQISDGHWSLEKCQFGGRTF